MLNDTLQRYRYTKTQTELEINRRVINVANSFSVEKPEKIADKNILLINNGVTTGATSSKTAHALKESGANVVFVMTLPN